jgi:hypothetical protein
VSPFSLVAMDFSLKDLKDLNAIILHCMGIDARRFSFPFQGLDQKLLGVESMRVVREVLG